MRAHLCLLLLLAAGCAHQAPPITAPAGTIEWVQQRYAAAMDDCRHSYALSNAFNGFGTPDQRAINQMQHDRSLASCEANAHAQLELDLAIVQRSGNPSPAVAAGAAQ